MDDINLVVAKATIEGVVDLDAEAPVEVEGVEGGKLAVKFPFRYEEVSLEEDNFRLQLTSELNGAAAEPATMQHFDRRGITDDKRGFIAQEYELPEAGEHELTWRAAVEYTEGDHRETHDVEGAVRITVKPAEPEPL